MFQLITLMLIVGIAGMGWALYLFDTSGAMAACPVLGVSAILLLLFGGLAAKLSRHDMRRLWEVTGGTTLLGLGLAGIVWGLFYQSPKETIAAVVTMLGVVAMLGGIALLISKKADQPDDDDSPTSPTSTCTDR